ncbi:hypothetical protein H8E52_04795 [bacterium]|nr:hypothetical protein [bacterium]
MRRALFLLLTVCVIGFSVLATPAIADIKGDFVALMNIEYGRVCEVKIEGWVTKTIKVDWTSETVLFHTMRVFAEIGDAKELLYADGVRYFKFPNDAGGYNIIDWKTGEKRSVDESAPYFFPN